MATYYVSSTGNDLNNGTTTSTPWKTPGKGFSTMVAGDSVLFKKGDTFSGSFTISKSGTVGNVITIGAYGTGAAPKFIGTGSTINSLFYMYNRAYITFDGLDITDPTMSPTDRSQDAKIQRVFTLDGTSNNIIIQNCSMSLIGVGGYFVGGTNSMIGCNIGNLRMVVDTNQGYQPGNDDDYGANPLVISSSNNTITGNYFYDCYADSYDYTVDGGGIELYNRSGPMNNNFIAYNTFKNTGGIFEITGNAADNTFIYNKVINVGAVVYMQSGFTLSQFKFYNNVFIENATPTIPSDINGRLFSGNLTANSVILKNNVFQLSNGTKVGTDSDIVHQYNVYKISGTSSVGYSLHGTELLNPSTVFTSTTGDPLTWDLTPDSGSALIDAGVDLDLTRDFAGNAVGSSPDIGLIEKVVSAILTASATATAITCNGGNSTVTVSASGGTGPYVGTGTFTRTAGTHSFTVTDAAAGSVVVNIIVTQPELISGSISATSIVVNGGTSTLTVTATGGTSPYTYRIDGGAYQSSNVFSSVAAGNHTVTIKDANNCTKDVSTTVTEPLNEDLQIILLSRKDVTRRYNGWVLSPRNGAVTLSATGGTLPYVYNINGASWRNSTGKFSNLSAGTYRFGVKDAAGTTSYIDVRIYDCSSGRCI